MDKVDRQLMIQAAITRAFIRAVGCQAENKQREHLGQSMAYESIDDIIDDEGISKEQITAFLEATT